MILQRGAAAAGWLEPSWGGGCCAARLCEIILEGLVVVVKLTWWLMLGSKECPRRAPLVVVLVACWEDDSLRSTVSKSLRR